MTFVPSVPSPVRPCRAEVVSAPRGPFPPAKAASGARRDEILTAFDLAKRLRAAFDAFDAPTADGHLCERDLKRMAELPHPKGIDSLPFAPTQLPAFAAQLRRRVARRGAHGQLIDPELRVTFAEFASACKHFAAPAGKV